ncbi:hypothetical protein ABEB36_000508 [Hypothenemus hampei]|uniref:BTB domain-containing protein n=1 Tax=Hypothenemus hampei TaxID=57062 RepID=A0ABD1FBJ0_HYPHA
MSASSLEASIASLQKSKNSSTLLLKALVSIRNEVDWPKNKQNVAKLRLNGCVKQLVAVLSATSQKSCVDLALSILGNCFMDRTFVVEAVTQHSIISVLSQLLKRYQTDDSVNGRTFRIIGNMCQHRDQWSTIIIDRKPFIVTQLVTILKKASQEVLAEGEKVSEATIITALRALRELQNPQTVTTLVSQFEALQALGALFIKYCLRWQKDKQQNEKLLLDIIRVIYEFSRFRYYNSILAMRNTERGDSLVYLTNVLILQPRKVVKILMNFIRSCQLKSELPVPEICDKFIAVLDSHSLLKDSGGHCHEYLQCLCYLLEHPANRNHDRCGRAIHLLIRLLKDIDKISNNAISCCTLLIHTLNKFKYDDSLMLAQLTAGTIPILVDKMTWLVGSPEVFSLKHSSEKKRKYDIAYAQRRSFTPIISKKRPLRDDILKECTAHSSDEELDVFCQFRLNFRSPSPSSSSDTDSIGATSWSESNSTPKRNLVNESDSDDYSPVCSEADDSESNTSQDQMGKNAFTSEFPESMESEGNDIEDVLEDSRNVVLTSLKSSLGHEIVKLIKSYVKCFVSNTQLANADLLVQLTKWAIKEEFNVKEIICDIIKCHDHLIPLMKSQYIFLLNDMHAMIPNHQSCSRCLMHAHFAYTVLKGFNEMAESGAGKGDIAYRLLRGDLETKQKLVKVIPFIVYNRRTLSKLMLDCLGLGILTKFLLEANGQNDRLTIRTLTQLATNCLSIDNPTKPLKNHLKLSVNQYELPEICNNIVTFEFDDGGLVMADRDFLAEKSEYFNGLLNGHFMEREQHQISLSRVESGDFQCLLYLLENMKKTDIIEVDLELETLLNLIQLSDRYLLSDLCIFLTDAVQQFRLASETVPVIYNWSVESGTNFLRIESVAYGLVAPMTEAERYSMFKNLFDLGYREHLVEDIENLLKRYLVIRDCGHEDGTERRRPLKKEMKHRLLKYNV